MATTSPIYCFVEKKIKVFGATLKSLCLSLSVAPYGIGLALRGLLSCNVCKIMHRIKDLSRKLTREVSGYNANVVSKPDQLPNPLAIQVSHRIFGGEFVTDCRKQLILRNLIGWHRATLREGRALLTNDYLFLRVIGRSAILVIH